MHLGGCLAYGLGNYQKALRWYTKVLDLDSRHLEATSNLAATLLALGRRQEAEQHWTTVVKLAPNHFEAVEHLVGLLCNEQRGKDAIKIIEYVERYLKYRRTNDLYKADSECSSSTASRSPVISELSDRMVHDFDADAEGYGKDARDLPEGSEPGYGSSGYAIPGSDNGRILSLVHAKGNMLYALGDNVNAAKAFEDAVSIACGRKFGGIQGIVKHVLSVISATPAADMPTRFEPELSSDPVLLMPEQAVQTARLCFPHFGELPGLQYLSKDPQSLSRKTAVSTTSNSLLSLAKIFQDSMSQTSRNAVLSQLKCGVRDILALYYLSLSLQPSPSTANNVGILLASVQQSAPAAQHLLHCRTFKCDIPGVVPGSGIALALAYYNYGLNLDARHAHLYTNLGSLLKDIGQLDAAIDMYKSAVRCDPRFDIALANLANAVKDKGRISEAIEFYKRAVDVSPDFAEAVCGLANALNSVCGWHARGGIAANGGKQDRWHVDQNGMLLDARADGASSSGWIKRVVDIVAKQLAEGEHWGRGTLTDSVIEDITRQVTVLDAKPEDLQQKSQSLRKILASWSGRKWEGARIIRLVERATRRLGWHWYQDKHIRKKQRTASSYIRPQLPSSLTVPTAPTVLPFHTFTCPVSAKQVRQISQRNGLRISASTLQSPWLPSHVYPPPAPPSPFLRSVFGMHDPSRVEAYCYATTASDSSVHRRQIEAEAPVFHDASNWSAERLVNQIVQDGIHILVNLNGYTRGARNEVFAARPAPIQMSFMGFAGTLGAEWCDYLLADETAVPPSTLRPWRRNLDLEDVVVDENSDDGDKDEDWVYGENIIYCRDTAKRRWQMRKELFPTISDDTIIFGNFNQLYKIEPTTFRTWLRILARVPNSILWLLRFPDLGEHHLKATAAHWAGPEVASRVIFTDVAPKHMHISRARVCDLFLDTAECNAHTTAADVRVQNVLAHGGFYPQGRAAPKHTPEYASAVKDLVAGDEDEYEELAVRLGNGLLYPKEGEGVGRGRGRLVELRRLLTESRWGSALFDTRRWVRDLEDAYQEAWRRWVEGEGGDIWLDKLPRGGMVVKEVGEK
ncbi:hypothetical protein H2203_005728 [Taxawa tesnikishii (nom. ined.)]|nr:hypothetical protein H2203_005728 [Dothideales sp. JES 119]